MGSRAPRPRPPRSTSRSSESSSRSETRRFLPLDQTPRFSTLSRSRRSTATISSRSSRSSRTSKVFASEFCDDLTKVSKLRTERRWVRMPGWTDYGDDLDYVERLFMENKNYKIPQLRLRLCVPPKVELTHSFSYFVLFYIFVLYIHQIGDNSLFARIQPHSKTRHDSYR